MIYNMRAICKELLKDPAGGEKVDLDTANAGGTAMPKCGQFN